MLDNKGVQAADYTIDFMLTNSLSTKVLRVSFARKDEAAGNNGLPLGTNALQVRREAQDFRRGKSDAALRGNLNVFSEVISSLRAESPKGIASLSSTAAGLLQSFITSFASSVSHKSLPSARYRLAPMLSILPAFSTPDLKVFLLLKKSFKSSEGGQGETV